MIVSDKELSKLLDVLGKEIANAHAYYRLHDKLIEAIPDYQTEYAQSNTFWTLTMQALFDSALLHLCRVYDAYSTSLSLANLLMALKMNSCLFSKENFEARLADNPFVESLSQLDRTLSPDEIDKDILLVTEENKTVKKLLIWRHNVIAHRGAKVSLGKNQILADNPLSEDEIKSLLEIALSTFNKYSSLYRASTHTPYIVGQDDYQSTLNYIRAGLQQKHGLSQRG